MDDGKLPSELEQEQDQPVATPWYNPRGWSVCKKVAAVAIILVIIVVVIVVTVEGVKANRYPNYKPLNYTLADTFEGTSFFDNFDYFSGQDPTDGFVV